MSNCLPLGPQQQAFHMSIAHQTALVVASHVSKYVQAQITVDLSRMLSKTKKYAVTHQAPTRNVINAKKYDALLLQNYCSDCFRSFETADESH